ncbi:MAG: hypothetical protein LBQ15_03375 [Clostridium sp.]|jgi:hypothetical protein|nr:hypothetical protein [Clostridium sp.]
MCGVKKVKKIVAVGSFVYIPIVLFILFTVYKNSIQIAYHNEVAVDEPEKDQESILREIVNMQEDGRMNVVPANKDEVPIIRIVHYDTKKSIIECDTYENLRLTLEEGIYEVSVFVEDEERHYERQ